MKELKPFHAGSAFPNMRSDNAHVVKGHSYKYNCIALAMGDESHWWWPNWKASFWPHVCKSGNDRDCFRTLFEHAKAEAVTSEDVEPGFVKLAVFAKHDAIKHIARQQIDGAPRRWLSKCGNGLAIVHDLWEMNGGMYGDVERLLKVPECEWNELRKLS